MKLMTTLATVALLWGGAVEAKNFAVTIKQAYAAAGYANVTVKHVGNRWVVTGDLNGVTQSFVVDRKTGVGTPVDAPVPHGKKHTGAALRTSSADAEAGNSAEDSAAEDVGDDNGGVSGDDSSDGGSSGSTGAGSDDAGADGAGGSGSSGANSQSQRAAGSHDGSGSHGGSDSHGGSHSHGSSHD